MIFMNIPTKITDALPAIKKKVLAKEKTKLYAKANSCDKFLLVMIRPIVDELMRIVINMTGEELSVDDWWDKGFRNKRNTSCWTPDHSGLVQLAANMAKELYKEVNND